MDGCRGEIFWGEGGGGGGYQHDPNTMVKMYKRVSI